MKFTILTFLLIFISTFALAQKMWLNIGDDKDEVKQYVSTKTMSEQHSGNNVSYNVKYSNGAVSEITQCYKNYYIYDFGVYDSFCVHYIIKNGTLAYTLTQYQDTSISALKQMFDMFYQGRKAGDYYYTADRQNYFKVYQSKSGMATVKYGASYDLPQSIISKMNN